MLFDIAKVKNVVRVGFVVMTLALVVSPLLSATVVSAADDPFGVDIVGDATALGGKDTDLRETVGNIIKVALSFLGVIAIVIVLIGGFKYMTSGGDDTKTAAARNYIIAGIIGLAIVLSAYAITSFVMDRLLEATKGE
ncbi:MAG: hypothetical protein AAB575_00315 [Patescibacteria group bacterium]|mgnify:CR=1 FL=1